ncbi:hypothetical protein [Arthrobacter sp. JZ12]|uniref:hypothetical protein n=1 Tax=Arthrobacter sp. JZ12 TaxID=2654190 RepID=UPI002B48C8E2|nr:hypothetical protein [Arthrobacter sp. JZ12]
MKDHQDSVTNRMGSIADHLKVPDSWVRLSQHIEREQHICFNDKSCPAFSRSWQADRVLHAEDLRQLARKAGWNLKFDGSCTRAVHATGFSRLCSATATIDGHRLSLYLDSPGADSDSVVRMSLSAEASS